MSNISLSMSKGSNSTIISNRFIDEFMPDANGTYVKVYIYLLRLISDSSNISLSLIAEHLDETEKDIRRALKYWEKTGIIKIEYDSEDQITGIDLSPVCTQREEKPAEIIQLRTETVTEKAPTIIPVAEAPTPVRRPAQVITPDHRPTYSAAQVKEMCKDNSISCLMKALEQKLGKPVSPADLQLILYTYESLGFGTDLIEYLYDYCIAREKTTSAYMEKVALAWAESGIKTAEEAQERNALHSASIQVVMKAFGLTGQTVTPIQTTFIQKWFNDLGFSAELVTEACNRAVLSKNKADFKCADRILEDWSKKNVHTLADLAKVDAEHTASASLAKPAPRSRSTQSTNSFNSFNQRDYDDEEFDRMFFNKKQG